ncbi:hypothetical protein M513_04458 [Trichuris suis]|uniref:Uncharacterized protein n=1 Tax=Trichuris suis TaxID=68888 RepID=A0A085MC12_9BILA|nr:hypothetical protein M513_04458 [Trichuris suis]
MSLRWYFLNIRDEESVASFLREKGESDRERSCPSCHHEMEFCSRGQNVCAQWRYSNQPCHTRLSARKGTGLKVKIHIQPNWLGQQQSLEGARRRLSLEKAIGLILAWSNETSSIKF